MDWSGPAATPVQDPKVQVETPPPSPLVSVHPGGVTAFAPPEANRDPAGGCPMS